MRLMSSFHKCSGADVTPSKLPLQKRDKPILKVLSKCFLEASGNL